MPPKVILNAPTKLMKREGYGEGYRYDHDEPDAFSGPGLLARSARPAGALRPVERGFEREIRKRLDWWAEAQAGQGRALTNVVSAPFSARPCRTSRALHRTYLRLKSKLSRRRAGPRRCSLDGRSPAVPVTGWQFRKTDPSRAPRLSNQSLSQSSRLSHRRRDWHGKQLSIRSLSRPAPADLPKRPSWPPRSSCGNSRGRDAL